MRVIAVLLLTLSAVTPASSVFVSAPTLLAQAGSGALISMLLGAVLVAPIACVYAELSSAFPIAGGEYAMVGRTLGPAAGFAILGVTVVLNMLAPALLALGVSSNLATLIPGLDQTWTAVAVVAATTVLGVLHVRVNAWVTGVFLLLELMALAALVVLGAAHPHQPVQDLVLHPVMLAGGGFRAATPAAIGLAVSVAIFAYNGFGGAVYFVEEMHEAPRLVARAILWAGAISVATVFLPVAAVLIGAPDLKALLGAENPFADFLLKTGGPWLRTIIGAAVALAIFNAALATVLQNARFFYSSGRDEAWRPAAINSAFLETHPRFNSPWIATLAAGGSAILACFIGLERLLVLTGAGLSVTYAALCVGTVAGRRTGSSATAAWRMPLYPWVPIVGFAGSAYALWAQWLDPDVGRKSLIATCAVLAVSLAYYALVLKRRGAWVIKDPFG